MSKLMRSLFFLMALLLTESLLAQPANDECSGATVGNELGKLQRRGVLEKGRLKKGKRLLMCV